MENLIIFGAEYLIFLMIAIAAVMFLLLPEKQKKKTAIFAALVLPFSYLLAKILSFFFYNPRPFVIGNFTPLIAHAADNGFPSDHTLLAAALTVVVYSFSKKASIFFLIATIFVAMSRVLAGVHSIIDVLGSMFVVLVVSFLVEKHFPKKKIVSIFSQNLNFF